MKIVVAGDYCPQNRVAELFGKDRFDIVLGEVKKIISDSDYSIVNLECPITIGKEKPIAKNGPNLKSTENSLKALKWAGFDCVTLANNHILDYGEGGLCSTLTACKKYGIETVGAGVNLDEASSVLYKQAGDKTLAIINCCEHEFSIATKTTAGSNPLNPIKQYYEIKESKKKADYTIIIVHGGHELWQLPSPRMQETYRFFIDAGADAVINHHQHCYSGYEIYNGKPIFYGIGNFCFDKNSKEQNIWNEGYLVFLELNDLIKFELLPYIQCENEATIKIIDKNNKKFVEGVEKINQIIENESELQNYFDKLCEKRKNIITTLLSPFTNMYLLELCSRGLIPSFVTKKKKLVAENYIICESHRDIVASVINHN